jgi:transposase
MAKRKLSTFERLQRGEKLKRQERREIQQKLAAEDPELQIVHPDAAGIDVGSASHFVSVPAGRDPQPVREFGSWTEDLRKLAAWLLACGIRTVAMQSTGVYWIALLDVLEKAGLEVFLVNAQGTKNLPGRKSDVQECQWLRKLHTYGLLRNSFRPPEEIRGVRTIWRLRSRMVTEAGSKMQQMQKALTTMNVQLQNAISDISGKTGMAIIRAIVAGERDPRTLAKLRDDQIRASEEEIAHSLDGHWQDDVLFELKEVLEDYEHKQKQIGECDQEIKKWMAKLKSHPRYEAKPEEASEKKPLRKPRKNKPSFDLKGELRRIFGVDLTRIDGIDVMTAQVILTELGPDLSAFPSEGDFASWLELVPRNDITGGRTIRKKARKSKNRVANALRMAAETLWRSDSYLGARYRKYRGRMEGQPTVKAMAHYLACLVYRLLTKGQEYVDKGAAHFERKRKERDVLNLQRKAAELGLKLVAA